MADNKTARGLAFRTGSGELVAVENGRFRIIGDSQVDICIVIDTTGSMSDKIDGLLGSLSSFVDELSTFSLKWRITSVPFGDLTIPGDRIVADNDFEESVEGAKKMIQSVPRFSGGGNSGESSLEALNAAMLKDYRPDAVKILILLTDEPPLVSANYHVATTAADVREKEFICFAVTRPNEGYEEIANGSGGEWAPIGDRMDSASLVRFLSGMLDGVARVAKEVVDIGGGSVSRYLALRSKQRPEM